MVLNFENKKQKTVLYIKLNLVEVVTRFYHLIQHCQLANISENATLRQKILEALQVSYIYDRCILSKGPIDVYIYDRCILSKGPISISKRHIVNSKQLMTSKGRIFKF